MTDEPHEVGMQGDGRDCHTDSDLVVHLETAVVTDASPPSARDQYEEALLPQGEHFVRQFL